MQWIYERWVKIAAWTAKERVPPYLWCVRGVWWRVPRIGEPYRALLSTVGLFYCLAITGCDPTAFGGIALAPRPAARIDSTLREAVFTSVSRVVQQRGIEPFGPTPGQENEGWIQCFAGHGVTLCGKQKDDEIQLLMEQFFTPRLSPYALGVRQELADTLRAEFALVQVRECKLTPPPLGLIKRGECKNFDLRMHQMRASDSK